MISGFLELVSMLNQVWIIYIYMSSAQISYHQALKQKSIGIHSILNIFLFFQVILKMAVATIPTYNQMPEYCANFKFNVNNSVFYLPIFLNLSMESGISFYKQFLVQFLLIIVFTRDRDYIEIGR